MPTKDNNTIKYNQGEKSIKLPLVIYADLEYLLEKMSTCINNLNESSTTEINKHTPSGYSIFTHCSFDKSKNKLNYYRGNDCMKKFCKDLIDVFKRFKLENLGQYHDLYVQSDTLLLADVFENFRDMCVKVYELDPAHIPIITRTSMASLFKEN